MNTTRGKLLYSPQERQPLQILTNFDIFDLWPLIEPIFWSLCGLDIVFKEGTLSFSLELNPGKRDLFLLYESRKKIFLNKLGEKKSANIAPRLEALFSSLNGMTVKIEGDKEHFKISAVPRE